HHSQTLPCMSYKPNAFGALLPTRCVLDSEFSSYHAKSLSVSGALPVAPARHAYSHSASLGKRYVNESLRSSSFFKKLCTSNHDTFSTGQLSQSLKLDGFSPITACHCAWVTSNLPR